MTCEASMKMSKLRNIFMLIECEKLDLDPQRIRAISLRNENAYLERIALLDAPAQPKIISEKVFHATQSSGSSLPAQQLLTPSRPEQLSPITIFMAYARKDEKLCQAIEQQLILLRLQGLNIIWYDSEITAGMVWEEEEEEHLNKANVILLLISSDFLSSEYCYGKQVQLAVKRHNNNKEAWVIPIILHPCLWDRTPFARIQPLPKDGKAVSKWSNKHDAYLDIAMGIRKAVEFLEKRSSYSSQDNNGTP